MAVIHLHVLSRKLYLLHMPPALDWHCFIVGKLPFLKHAYDCRNHIPNYWLTLRSFNWFLNMRIQCGFHILKPISWLQKICNEKILDSLTLSIGAMIHPPFYYRPLACIHWQLEQDRPVLGSSCFTTLIKWTLPRIGHFHGPAERDMNTIIL